MKRLLGTNKENWSKIRYQKNIGTLFQASQYLDSQSLKNIYFSFIHSSLKYCNMACASNNKTQLNFVFEETKT